MLATLLTAIETSFGGSWLALTAGTWMLVYFWWQSNFLTLIFKFFIVKGKCEIYFYHGILETASTVEYIAVYKVSDS
jgi:hypothetical protein